MSAPDVKMMILKHLDLHDVVAEGGNLFDAEQREFDAIMAIVDAGCTAARADYELELAKCAVMTRAMLDVAHALKLSDNGWHHELAARLEAARAAKVTP